jgi:hypothetical protein
MSLKNHIQNLNIKNCADLKFLKKKLTKNYEQSIFLKKKKNGQRLESLKDMN